MADHAPHRKRLPDTRRSVTAKGSVGNHEFYVVVGFYPDTHQPGEIFVKIAKEGSTMCGMADGLALTMSVALQHGVPWAVLSDKYRKTKFEPSNDKSTSLLDAIAQKVDDIMKADASLRGDAV